MRIAADIQNMIRLIREGKREGFDLLYEKYAGSLYGILSRVTGDKCLAENILELTFVNIFKRIHQYNGSNTFFAWILQIAQSALDESGMAEKVKSERSIAAKLLSRQAYEELLKETVDVELIKKESRSTLRPYR